MFLHGNVNDISHGWVPDVLKFRYFERQTGKYLKQNLQDIPGKYYKENLEIWLEELEIFVTNILSTKCLKNFQSTF